MSAKAYGEGLSQSSLLSALYVECRSTHVNLRRQVTMLARGMARSCEHGTKTNSIRKAAATNGDVCSGMRRAQIAFQRHDHIILKMLKFLNTNT
jgi:hypothetical protein